MAAKEEGDARYALDLLRTAGEIADEEDTSDYTFGSTAMEEEITPKKN